MNIAYTGRRVLTGVVKFGADWPGVFIRGDDCGGYAVALEYILKNGSDGVVGQKALRELKGLFDSAYVGQGTNNIVVPEQEIPADNDSYECDGRNIECANEGSCVCMQCRGYDKFKKRLKGS